MSRRAPLLRGVPRDGSPTSSLLPARSDFLLPHLAHLRLLSGSVTRRRTQDLPSSSATLAMRAPALRPRWNLGELASGDRSPTLRSRGIAFRALRPVGFHDFPISGSDSAAHMLAVYASRPRLPVYCLTAAQDSLPAGGLTLPDGSSTRWVTSHGFCSCQALHGLPPCRGLLGARRAGEGGQSEKDGP
jgi:hypothetical protein